MVRDQEITCGPSRNSSSGASHAVLESHDGTCSMGSYAILLSVFLLATAPPSTAPADSTQDSPEVAAEPPGGVGVSPIELIPRVELRQSYLKLEGGVSGA